MAKIAVLGYGTVGSGVVEVLERNADSIKNRAGEPVEVKYVLDLRDFPGDPIQEKITHDFNDILNDPEVDVVVEVMGGTGAAYTFTKSALEAGKSVCTSNKALVAAHGAELMALAREKNINYMFEASVGGGIPVIRPINESLTADKILQITGIMNGTTNYILTKMRREGTHYEETLKEAQALGYAERDPSADVDGWDACRKIAILTSLAQGGTVDFNDIQTEGISDITYVDFKYANKLGVTIKLLATSKVVNDKVYAYTAPFMLESDHPLYNVNGVLNGIYVNGNMVGDTMFFGPGAGKLPTASAVCGDIVEAVKNKDHNVIVVWEDKKVELGDNKDLAFKYFVRVKDEEGEAKKVRDAFGLDVQPIRVQDVEGEFAFVTEEMAESDFVIKSKLVDLIKSIRFDDTAMVE